MARQIHRSGIGDAALHYHLCRSDGQDTYFPDLKQQHCRVNAQQCHSDPEALIMGCITTH